MFWSLKPFFSKIVLEILRIFCQNLSQVLYLFDVIIKVFITLNFKLFISSTENTINIYNTNALNLLNIFISFI